MRDPKYTRLAQIAELIQQRDFAQAARAAAHVAETRGKINEIDQKNNLQSHFSVSAAIAQERYAQLLMHQRYLLNQQLAIEMSQWLDATDKAKRALGRSEVLEKLMRKN